MADARARVTNLAEDAIALICDLPTKQLRIRAIMVTKPVFV
jgi:hypothetical protein